MSKLLNIVTTYDEELRELKSVATMNGFIVDLPDQVITKQEVATITLFADPVLVSSDVQSVIRSMSRVLLSAQVELQGWKSAQINKDKSDQFIAADTDPVEVFDQILTPGATPPISDDVGVLAFEAALNPPQ